MIEHVPWWSPLAGYALGWLMGRLDRETQDDPRRRINHENRRGPVGPPPLKLRRSEPDPPEQFIRLDPGSVQRGNGSGGPTTPKPDIIPKPQPAGGRLIREGHWWGGYQPRSQGGTTNPPPEAP